MEYVDVKPKCWPSMWLEKDWENRRCRIFKNKEYILSKVHDFEVRDDDVWLVTLPKCGTTWMQEMAWLIMNSFDFDKALTTDLDDRSPFLEIESMFPPGAWDSVGAAAKCPSPRLIKTHLPLPLLPYQVWTKRPKIIYVFRNPKDVAVSHYYHVLLTVPYYGTKNEYLEKYTERPDFWPHVQEFWALRNEPNIFYTSYERMKSNLPGVIQEVCDFLNKPITAKQMDQMVKHLSFEKMKNNNRCNHSKGLDRIQKHTFEGSGKEEQIGESFMRKGKVGGYKDDFTDELEKMYDRWIQDNLEPLNIKLNDLLLL